ncbi:hypothetical protein VTK73DRAFT_2149 [Phialemonium thermophilum]|uniref:Uncharacterized protein n=1 Tax=Phialemonium thermophilum TaxID=223376 RepID=A0ABR3VSJ5_9PEZI
MRGLLHSGCHGAASRRRTGRSTSCVVPCSPNAPFSSPAPTRARPGIPILRDERVEATNTAKEWEIVCRGCSSLHIRTHSFQSSTRIFVVSSASSPLRMGRRPGWASYKWLYQSPAYRHKLPARQQNGGAGDALCLEPLTFPSLAALIDPAFSLKDSLEIPPLPTHQAAISGARWGEGALSGEGRTPTCGVKGSWRGAVTGSLRQDFF